MMKNILGMDGEDRALFCAYCGYCGTEIAWKGTGKRIGKRSGKRTWKRRRVVHVNICQEPSVIYFCNRDCKLNWIFKNPDVKFEKNTKGVRVKKEDKSIFDKAESEDNPDELEKYLKDNKVKILRQA